MTTEMPKIVTHLTGDVSGLAKAVAEGETLVDKYGENVEKKTREHGERAGEAGGRGLTDKLEEELGRPTVAERPLAGISKKVEAKFQEIGEKSGKGFSGAVETEVRTLETKLQGLADEMMRTGNFDLMKEFKSTKGDLGLLSRVKKEFEAVKAEALKLSVDALTPGDQGGGGSGVLGWIAGIAGKAKDALVSGLSSAMDNLPVPQGMVQWLVLGAVAAAPAIGAAINAGVLLGVGGGGIAVGVVAAFQDPRVKGAWSSAMTGIFDEFKKASTPLVDPLIEGAAKVQAAFTRAGPAIEASMNMAAPIVDHLTSGIATMIDNAGPGFAAAFAAAMPIMDMLATEMLPKMGDALNQFFLLISDGGPGAAIFFHDLINVVDVLIVGLGQLISWMSQAYEFGSRWGLLAGASLDVMGKMIPAGEGSKQALEGVGQGGDAAATGVDNAKRSLSDFIAEAFKMEDNQIALQKGLFDIGHAFDKNGQSLDINTEKGLANRQAMQHQIETIARWRQEQLDAGKSPGEVNLALDRQIKLMYDDALAHGANKAQLDLLIGSWRTVLELPSSKSFVTTYDRVYNTRGQPTTGYGASADFAGGGIYQHAADGMVTKPGIYQGRGDGFTVMAEQETKKEGYFPQNISGPHGYELLSEMASWKGWSIDTGAGRGGGHDGASAPTGGGGGSSQPLVVQLVVDGRVFYEQVVLPQQRQFSNNNGFSGGG